MWSDPRVIELSKKFVPVTDEVWRLQNTKTPDGEYFRGMAKHGHYGPTRKSQQGIYVFAPSGKFLSSINSTNADRVLAMMNDGLKKWQVLEPRESELNDQARLQHGRRYEYRQPTDGLVLALYMRDLPTNNNSQAQPAKKWNRDTVWLSEDEARQLVPPKPMVGDTYLFPKFFVRRLVALHLVDAVNGQTEHFSKEEVEGSSITGTVQRIDQDRIEIVLRGETRSESHKKGILRSPRGVTTKLLGEAVFDRKTMQWTSFECVAVGRRWGHTRFNDRRDGEFSSPIGFSMQRVEEGQAANVPAFIWAYGASWLLERP